MRVHNVYILIVLRKIESLDKEFNNSVALDYTGRND
jgi:hypothetical protein